MIIPNVARRIAANIAKLPELLRKDQSGPVRFSSFNQTGTRPLDLSELVRNVCLDFVVSELKGNFSDAKAQSSIIVRIGARNQWTSRLLIS
jgi:hypothetical protein